MCQLLLYDNVNQLYIYRHPPFWTVLPHQLVPLGHNRAPGWAPWAVQHLPTSCLFYTWWCLNVKATLSISATLSFPQRVYKFILYVCVSLPALQIGSSWPLCFQAIELFCQMTSHSKVEQEKAPARLKYWGWGASHLPLGALHSTVPQSISAEICFCKTRLVRGWPQSQCQFLIPAWADDRRITGDENIFSKS